MPEMVAFERDIEFANTDNEHLQVNLARPKQGEGPFPAVVCIQNLHRPSAEVATGRRT